MPEMMQNQWSCLLREKAAQLLTAGAVDRVLAWKRGIFDHDVTPAVFHAGEPLDELVYNSFCGANLSKYLIRECEKTANRVLVFLKPCDSFSFNQLLTEHRIEREKIYVIGVPCDGMLDSKRIRNIAGEGIASVEDHGDTVLVHTLYDGDVQMNREAALPDRCLHCKSKKHAAYDELIGEEGEIPASARFDQVAELEAMSEEERFAFWQNELSRCIRCNACRDVCPACTCEKCVFDNPASGVENKAASDSFEEKMFHIIRAFHVAGRCTDCGECSRVCPQQIPLHLLNRKFIKDINEFYGAYQAGESVGQRSPLLSFSADDPEVSDVVGGGGSHA